MDDDELWNAIDNQRLRTADLLESLAPADWDQASLCDAWTVRDVAAHLTLQQLSLGRALVQAFRHPGSMTGGMNRIIRESVRTRAGLPPEQLIAGIRGMVGSRRHNVGVTGRETLIDIVVHGQDIAIPLARPLDVPVDAAVNAADRVWSCRGSRLGRVKLRVFHQIPIEEYRLTATDTRWTVGDGPEVRGPILAILLLLTGRPVGLDKLTGEGATALAARLHRVHP